jgi:hypothetical protein
MLASRSRLEKRTSRQPTFSTPRQLGSGSGSGIHGLTRAISGSRPYANHTARFYRESAALRCSASPATRGSLRPNCDWRESRTERTFLMASQICGTHIGSDAITRPQTKKGNNRTNIAPGFRWPVLAAQNANPAPPTTMPCRKAELIAHRFHRLSFGVVMMSTF